MRKAFVPMTVIPGARRRVDSETLMAMLDSKGNSFWDMPAPVSYAQHKQWRRHKRTGERIAEPVTVPVYRGTSASYARWVKAQLRRNQRKAVEAQAEVDDLNAARQKSSQKAEERRQESWQ